MQKTIDDRLIDNVLNMFYGYLPYGVNYFSITYKLDIDAGLWEKLFDFLIKEDLIAEWGGVEKQILTEKGIAVITRYGGWDDYLKYSNPPK